MSKKACGFSIIMTVYDQARKLEANLPAFLTQAYDQDYEVIVVDESSTDDTKDVLTLQKNQYPRLYTTFLPKPNRLISRPKLAFTIGVKAAKHEWVIIADIDKPPLADDNLQAIAGLLDDHTDLVLGYIKAQKKKIRLEPFTRLDEAASMVIKTERGRGKGHYGKRLRYISGKYDFVIVRRELAHELLKLFEHRVSRVRLLGLKTGVCMRQMVRRTSTTVLTCE